MNTYYEVLRRRVRDLIAEHENVLGADAIISAVREAFEKEAMRVHRPTLRHLSSAYAPYRITRRDIRVE
jgi:hypothetical protein